MTPPSTQNLKGIRFVGILSYMLLNFLISTQCETWTHTWIPNTSFVSRCLYQRFILIIKVLFFLLPTLLCTPKPSTLILICTLLET